jgi:superfamily II DNA/RNA helicase
VAANWRQALACRVGRTGRAGRQGTAITFFVEDDAPRLKEIASCMRAAGCDVPAWLLQLRRGTAHTAAGPISAAAAREERQRKHKRQMIQQSKVCSHGPSPCLVQVSCMCSYDSLPRCPADDWCCCFVCTKCAAL